jgi:hypothetical protein
MHSYHGTGAVLRKLATFTGPEKAGCVFKFHNTQSAMSIQRYFTTNGKPAPARKSIYKWHKSFVETGLCEKKRTGRPPNLEIVDCI